MPTAVVSPVWSSWDRHDWPGMCSLRWQNKQSWILKKIRKNNLEILLSSLLAAGHSSSIWIPTMCFQHARKAKIYQWSSVSIEWISSPCTLGVYFPFCLKVRLKFRSQVCMQTRKQSREDCFRLYRSERKSNLICNKLLDKTRQSQRRERRETRVSFVVISNTLKNTTSHRG